VVATPTSGIDNRQRVRGVQRSSRLLDSQNLVCAPAHTDSLVRNAALRRAQIATSRADGLTWTLRARICRQLFCETDAWPDGHGRMRKPWLRQPSISRSD
jgi:hypothetical protein